MQERADGALLVKTMAGREIQDIDAAELAVRRLAYVPLDGGGNRGVGRLPQGREQSLCFAHPKSLSQTRAGVPAGCHVKFGGRPESIPAFGANIRNDTPFSAK